MSIWIAALRDNSGIIISIMTGFAFLLIAILVRIGILEVDDQKKTRLTKISAVLAVLLLSIAGVLLYDSAFPVLPAVIGKNKDDAKAIIESKSIDTPRFQGIPSSEANDTIVFIENEIGEALAPGTRVARDSYIICYYSLPLDDKKEDSNTPANVPPYESATPIAGKVESTTKPPEQPTKPTTKPSTKPSTTATLFTPTPSPTPTILLSSTQSPISYGDTLKVINCSEYISLRDKPLADANRLSRVYLGESVTFVKSADNGFFEVNYNGKTGYMLSIYLTPTKATSLFSTSVAKKEFGMDDLTLSSITIGKTTGAEIINEFGQQQSTVPIDGNLERWDYNGFALEITQKSQTVVALEVYDDVITGPRGIRMGDCIADTLSSFPLSDISMLSNGGTGDLVLYSAQKNALVPPYGAVFFPSSGSSRVEFFIKAPYQCRCIIMYTNNNVSAFRLDIDSER